MQALGICGKVLLENNNRQEAYRMKVVGISGTPRKGGNTECLIRECLNEFFKQGWTVLEFFLSEKTIKPCIGCDSCKENGLCVITDDDAGALFADLINCDAVIIGSPVYYRNVTAQLKAVFDRNYPYGYKTLEGKPGGAIAVGRGEGAGDRRGGEGHREDRPRLHPVRSGAVR
jgi:multimeric flavodoxin WrbA